MRGKTRFALRIGLGKKGTALSVVLSLAAVMTVSILIISVMNGLQGGQLDMMKDVLSFDISTASLSEEELSGIDGVESFYRYRDVSAMLSDGSVYTLRAIDPAILDNPRFADHFIFLPDDFVEGEISLPDFSRGDASVEITYLRRGRTATLAPARLMLALAEPAMAKDGLFTSSLAFTALSSIPSDERDERIGVYVSDSKAVSEIKVRDPEALTWQEDNETVYSALMLEKTVMNLFLFLMFVIIAVGIKRSVYRLVDKKSGEISLMRSYGARISDVRYIFTAEAMVFTVIGVVLGLVLGVLLSSNTEMLSRAASLVFGGRPVSLPVRIVPSELILLAVAVLLLTLVMTLVSVSRISKIDSIGEVADE